MRSITDFLEKPQKSQIIRFICSVDLGMKPEITGCTIYNEHAGKNDYSKKDQLKKVDKVSWNPEHDSNRTALQELMIERIK